MILRRAAVAGAIVSLFLGAGSAAAATSYESDACNSTADKYCFSIHFNSRGGQTWYSESPCFLSNRSIPDYFGYSPNQAALVRYVFRAGQIDGDYNTCRLGGDGEGQGVKNEAASATNAECGATHRVYFSSGYLGPSQAFSPKCGDYWPGENLISDLKNDNGSAKRI
ncbi:hypothetical protein [Streptomyces sp. NPDC093225]|uniref:hypothetical protein n=1 Tax=Streptomyces sp. NPDC093225 TaxID=3366034 RepID=UPI00382B8F21